MINPNINTPNNLYVIFKKREKKMFIIYTINNETCRLQTGRKEMEIYLDDNNFVFDCHESGNVSIDAQVGR